MQKPSVWIGASALVLVGLGFALNHSDGTTRTRPQQRSSPGPSAAAGQPELSPQTGGPCDPPAGSIPVRSQPVPDVRGLPLCDAMRLIQDHGLAVVISQRSASPQEGIDSDFVIGSQTPAPGTKNPARGTVNVVVLMPPVLAHAPVGRECRPENARLFDEAIRPGGIVDVNLVPRWMAVANPRQPFGFVGCMPREFADPSIDGGRAIRALWGSDRPGSPTPVFSTDGTLIGYSVSAAGFLPLNVVEQTGIVPDDAVARTPTYDEFNVSG